MPLDEDLRHVTPISGAMLPGASKAHRQLLLPMTARGTCATADLLIK
jgi:hypothetical protein